MKRKIIQIVVVPESEDYFEKIIALCDDGSLWEQRNDKDKAWKLIPTEKVEQGVVS